jgi:hypothetical protein
MKIAVLNVNGVQTDHDGKLRFYFLVADTYNFGANSATDVTNVENLLMFNRYNRFDYKMFRSSLATYVAAVGFANLSVADKTIASSHFVVSKADRDTVHTLTEQIVNGRQFHSLSVECRERRLFAAESELYNQLSKANADIVITDVVSGDLRESYLKYGREGTIEGDPLGIFDYIEARAGTLYAATGLAAKGYTPISGTLAELVTKIMGILKNGE